MDPNKEYPELTYTLILYIRFYRTTTIKNSAGEMIPKRCLNFNKNL